MADILVDELVRQIEYAKGNVATVARFFGVSRRTIYRRIKESTNAQSALQDARDTAVDDAESVLYQKAMDGEAWAVCFLLKTQGKSRGYVERTEYASKDDQPFTVKVIQGVSTDDL